jgi:hypothetical protein
LKYIKNHNAPGCIQKMIKYCLCVIGFILLCQVGHASFARENSYQLLTYDIFSEGKDIGDITLKLSTYEKSHIIIEHSHIKVSEWLWSIDITKVQSEEFEQGGVLKMSDGKILYDDAIYWTQISSYGSQYQAGFTSLDKITEQEKKQFSNLSTAAAEQVSNNSEDILLHTKSMFVGRKKQTERLSFHQGAFDTTWNNLPIFIEGYTGMALPDKLNILDPENLEIHQVSLSDLGYENVSVGAKEVQARHLKLSDGKFKPSHLWIYVGTNVGEHSLPYIIRYTGEDEDGTFEIVLKYQ